VSGLKLTDVPLKLGQRILVWSSCSDDCHVVKLEATTVKDVIVRNGDVRVVLGEGRWGACPTRSLEDTVWDRESFDAYVARKEPDPEDGVFYKTASGEKAWFTILKARPDGEEHSLKAGHRRFFRTRRSLGGLRWTLPGDADLDEHGFFARYLHAAEDLWDHADEYLDSHLPFEGGE
jgi:hypothetical protein